TISLPPNGHIGRFLTELFPTVASIKQIRPQVSLDTCLTSTCTALNGPGFLATALRLNNASSTFTAIPVIQRPSGGGLVRALPQIVVGGNPNGVNYQTILYLSPSLSSGVTGTADVLDDQGRPIPVLANGNASGGHLALTIAANRTT